MDMPAPLAFAHSQLKESYCATPCVTSDEATVMNSRRLIARARTADDPEGAVRRHVATTGCCARPLAARC